MLFIYLIVLFSLIISSNACIKKKLLFTCSYEELIILEYFFIGLIVVCYVFYKYITKQKINVVKHLHTRTIMFLFLTVIAALSSTYLNYYLINNFPISKITPILNPLIIIFTVLLGFFLFNEKITNQELSGILVIIGGIILLTYKFK